MANIKFSQFTNQAAADTTYLVGYDGTDNTNYTKTQIKDWLNTGTNRIPTLYNTSASLGENRSVTLAGFDLTFVATSTGKIIYTDGNQQNGYVLKSDTNGEASWAAETDTGVTSVTLAIGTNQTSPLTESITNRDLTITSNKYGGTDKVGYVPEGGSNITFLRGDGTWITPTNTNTNIANTDLNLNASRTLGLGASQNLTLTGSGTSKVTFSNLGGVEIARDLTVQKNVIIQGQGYSELHTGVTTATFDWNSGNVQSTTLGAGTVAFAPTNAKAGATYIISIAQTGTAVINWGSYVKWPSTGEPTLSGNAKTDVVTLICYDDSVGADRYYGSATLGFTS